MLLNNWIYQSKSTYLLIHGRYLRQPLGGYDFLMTPDMSSGHWLPLHTPNLVLYDCPTRYEMQNYKMQNRNIQNASAHPILWSRFFILDSVFEQVETWLKKEKRNCVHTHRVQIQSNSVYISQCVYICLLSIWLQRWGADECKYRMSCSRTALRPLIIRHRAALNAQTRLEIMTTLITKHNDKYFGKFVLKIIKTSNPDWITTFSVENDWKS